MALCFLQYLCTHMSLSRQASEERQCFITQHQESLDGSPTDFTRHCCCGLQVHWQPLLTGEKARTDNRFLD